MREDIIDSGANGTWIAETSTASAHQEFENRGPFVTGRPIGSPAPNSLRATSEPVELGGIKASVPSFPKKVPSPIPPQPHLFSATRFSKRSAKTPGHFMVLRRLVDFTTPLHPDLCFRCRYGSIKVSWGHVSRAQHLWRWQLHVPGDQLHSVAQRGWAPLPALNGTLCFPHYSQR